MRCIAALTTTILAIALCAGGAIAAPGTTSIASTATNGQPPSDDRQAEPRSLKDFRHVGVGVGTVSSALPAHEVLTWPELKRWLQATAAGPDEIDRVRARFDRFVREEHNPTVDRELTEFHAVAGENSKAMQAHGILSDEFEASSSLTRVVTRRAIEAIESMELRFVESLEPLLEPSRVRELRVLRARAVRRSARSITSLNRWIVLEWRDVVDRLPDELLTEEEIAAVRVRLADHEEALAGLLREWFNARLDAGERVLRQLRANADGAESRSPADAWRRPAAVVRRIRDLNRRTADALVELVAAVDEDRALFVRAALDTAMYPQISPDAEFDEARAWLTSVADDESLTPGQRSTAAKLLDELVARHAELTVELVATIDAFDDEILTGVGFLRPSDLPATLAEPLAGRSEMLRELIDRAAGVFGDDVLARHPRP